MNATGCIGFAAEPAGVVARRVIESFSVDPASKSSMLWVDVFVENISDASKYLKVLHRGSLLCQNVTRDAWRSDSQCAVRRRIVELHKQLDPITPGDGVVGIAGAEYPLWEEAEGGLEPVVGGKSDRDVPFSMWRLGPFPPRERRLVRIRLTMTRDSYLKQIGENAKEFYAYGDAILLDRIAEDLIAYTGTDKGDYENGLEDFLPTRIVPEVFEYMLISLDDSVSRWRTTPLTYNFSPQVVPREYSDTTHWFVARYSQVSSFRMKAENAFVLKIAEEPVFAGTGGI